MRDARFSEGPYIEMLNETQNGNLDHVAQKNFTLWYKVKYVLYNIT